MGKEAEAIIVANKKAALGTICKGQSFIKSLASIGELTLELETEEKPEQAVAAVVQGVEIFLPLKGLIDIDKEKVRLEKELNKVEQEIKRLEKKLNNQGFLAKAPQNVIEKEKAKYAEYQANKEALVTRLESLKG